MKKIFLVMGSFCSHLFGTIHDPDVAESDCLSLDPFRRPILRYVTDRIKPNPSFTGKVKSKAEFVVMADRGAL